MALSRPSEFRSLDDHSEGDGRGYTRLVEKKKTVRIIQRAFLERRRDRREDEPSAVRSPGELSKIVSGIMLEQLAADSDILEGRKQNRALSSRSLRSSEAFAVSADRDRSSVNAAPRAIRRSVCARSTSLARPVVEGFWRLAPSLSGS